MSWWREGLYLFKSHKLKTKKVIKLHLRLITEMPLLCCNLTTYIHILLRSLHPWHYLFYKTLWNFNHIITWHLGWTDSVFLRSGCSYLAPKWMLRCQRYFYVNKKKASLIPIVKDMEGMKSDWHLKASEVQPGLRMPLAHAFISILINLCCVFSA